MRDFKLYINGEFIDSTDKQKIINPATGEVVAGVAVADKKLAEKAVQAARNAFDSGHWSKLPLDERKKYILKISEGILNKAAELAELETLNTGKPIKESTFMDIPSSAETFKYFGENLDKFIRDESVDIATQLSSARGDLLREPVGVVVLIIPWNYPLIIASWKLAQALAAGNCVILKPSSITPLTALELAKIIHDAGLPKGVVNVITGSGDTIGEALCSSKDVDMISFTGSNAVGKKILEYSSACVKKTIMELGGKSAAIVLEDADLEVAVNGSLCSIFLNQGQMCTAMSRIFVHEKIYDKFVEDFVNKAGRIKLGNGMDFQTQMGPLVSEAQRKKVIDFVNKAKKEGAKILCGGNIPAGEGLGKGSFFEPTVISEVTPQMSLFKDEVFGPVACISKFSTAEEAVKLANASDFALAACIWSRNLGAAKQLGQRINAGTVWINTYGMFFNELSYGGFKQSGFGKELGREGLLEYTRLKNIVTDLSPDAKPLVNYWYGF